MSNDHYELVQHCIDTKDFVTVKVHDRYFLFHQNIIKHTENHQLDLDLSPAIIRRIVGLKSLSVKDAQIVSYVNPSYYDLIVFPDKSLVYTHKRTLTNGNENNIEMKVLPYYVYEDLELLRNIGMTTEDIDSFIEKLDANDNMDLFNSNKYDNIIQKIIFFTDVSTRLKCRQVSHKWKEFVDNSTAWHRVKLTKACHHVDRALNYFQNTDIRELDLSESTFESTTFELGNDIHIYSLRSLCISTDHPLELFTLLFKIAPFLQHIKLIQTYNSSLKYKSNNQLYDCVNFVICQCQQRLKCLRRLHIQLRSISDQIYLESSSLTSIPISYEVIAC